MGSNVGGVLGFDPSLTSSGYAYYGTDGTLHKGRIMSKKLRGAERLRWIREQYMIILEEASGVDLVVYEGYAMGAKGQSFSIGELGGVLKTLTYELGIDMLVVPPMSLKKYAVGATGKGNADKEQVMQAVKDTWGLEVTRHDEADAFILLQMGLHYLNLSETRSKVRAGLLKKCSFHPGGLL